MEPVAPAQRLGGNCLYQHQCRKYSSFISNLRNISDLRSMRNKDTRHVLCDGYSAPCSPFPILLTPAWEIVPVHDQSSYNTQWTLQDSENNEFLLRGQHGYPDSNFLIFQQCDNQAGIRHHTSDGQVLMAGQTDRSV